MKKYIVILVLAFVASPLYVKASILYSQSINLSPGWNIVSTPKVLESHSFSEEETSENFDIYILDASNTSGWSTLADLGQTEFTPLYGYFINNKTGVDQTLTFNYKDVSIPEQLFSRTFSTPGWYSIGIANSTYAKNLNSENTDSNNPDHILNSMISSSVHYGDVIDFTDANYITDKNSVAIVNPWKNVARSAEISNSTEINTLNDFRETKGYAIYIKDANTNYSGLQNTTIPQCSDGVDNDENGLIDMNDPGCNNTADDDETLPTLTLLNSSNNPSSSVLSVDETDTSDWHQVLAFRLESEGDTISLQELALNLTIGGDLDAYSNVVNDVQIEIDGQVFDDYTTSIEDNHATALTFDINGNYTIGADEIVEVVVSIQLKPASDGNTIKIDTISVVGGEESNISDTSIITGASHTLALSVPSVSVVSKAATTNETNSIGYISYNINIEAIDGDVIFDSAADILYDLIGVDSNISTSTFTKIAGAASNTGTSWTITEGDDATFALDVTITPADVGDNGTYRVNLDSVAGVTLDDLSSSVNLAYGI